MVATKDFDQFLRNTRSDSESPPSVDWTKRRKDWLQALDKLYELIENYLSKYISDKSISVEYLDAHINEEHLGSYSARKMNLVVGKNVVEISPVGTLIFGAYGRVDVLGKSARLRLILVEPAANEVRLGIRVMQPGEQVSRPEPPDFASLSWKIASDPPNVRLYELTQEALFDAIMTVAAA